MIPVLVAIIIFILVLMFLLILRPTFIRKVDDSDRIIDEVNPWLVLLWSLMASFIGGLITFINGTVDEVQNCQRGS